MNLNKGLAKLKELLKDGDQETFQQFLTLEFRLKQAQDSTMYGNSEQLRTEIAAIATQLNRIALKHSTISFNDLCEDSIPALPISPILPPTQPAGQNHTQQSNPLYREKTHKDSVDTIDSTDTITLPFIPLHSTQDKRAVQELPSHRKPKASSPDQQQKGVYWGLLVGVPHMDVTDARQTSSNTDNHEEEVTLLYKELVLHCYHPDHLLIYTDTTPTLPTKHVVESTLQSLAQQAAPEDTLLFYYHGSLSISHLHISLAMQDSTLNTMPDTALSLATLCKILQQAQAYTKMLLLEGTCDEGALQYAISSIQKQFETIKILIVACREQQNGQSLAHNIIESLPSNSAVIAQQPNNTNVITLESIALKCTHSILARTTGPGTSILCRCYPRKDKSSYCLDAYYYFLNVQVVLEKIRQSLVIQQEAFLYSLQRAAAITLIDNIANLANPEPQPGTLLPSLDDSEIADQIEDIHQQLETIRWSISELEMRDAVSSDSSVSQHQEILQTVKRCAYEVRILLQSYRHMLVSESTDQ